MVINARKTLLFSSVTLLVIVAVILLWNFHVFNVKQGCGGLSDQAIADLESNSERGSADSALKLFFYYTEDCSCCDEEALKWLRRAAELGHARGKFILYKTLISTGDNKNRSEAILNLGQSANLGYIYAVSEIGHIFLEGKVVEKDRIKAEEWYKKASLQGDPHSIKALTELLIEKADRTSLINAYAWSLVLDKKYQSDPLYGKVAIEQQNNIVIKARECKFDVVSIISESNTLTKQLDIQMEKLGAY